MKLKSIGNPQFKLTNKEPSSNLHTVWYQYQKKEKAQSKGKPIQEAKKRKNAFVESALGLQMVARLTKRPDRVTHSLSLLLGCIIHAAKHFQLYNLYIWLISFSGLSNWFLKCQIVTLACILWRKYITYLLKHFLGSWFILLLWRAYHRYVSWDMD